MKPLGTLAAFWRLPPATRRMALEAAVLLALSRALVRYVPLRHWRSCLDTSAPPGRCATAAGSSGTESGSRAVGWVVRRVARRLPFDARCLPQAVAAQWMLRRRRIPSQLRLGARDGTGPDMEMHAWLLVDGEAVVGGENAETYTPLPPFDNRTPAPGRGMDV